MAFLIIDEQEELRLELPDDTGDGKPGIIVYRRAPDEVKRDLSIRYGGGKHPKHWPVDKREAFMREAIRYGYVRSENFQRSIGGKLVDVSLTLEQVMNLPSEHLVDVLTSITSSRPSRSKSADQPPPIDSENPNDDDPDTDVMEIPVGASETTREEAMLGNS